jgi:hypothetical protein
MIGWADQGAPSTDFFQPPNPAALKAEDQEMDVPRAKLP